MKYVMSTKSLLVFVNNSREHNETFPIRTTQNRSQIWKICIECFELQVFISPTHRLLYFYMRNFIYKEIYTYFYVLRCDVVILNKETHPYYFPLFLQYYPTYQCENSATHHICTYVYPNQRNLVSLGDPQFCTILHKS